MFIVSRILFPVHLICSGIFHNLQNMLFDCFIAVCVAYCIQMNFQNCIIGGTSVPIFYISSFYFTVSICNFYLDFRLVFYFS